MRTEPFNILFLCTGNSARSILAEALMSREGGGKFRAWSAGSHPKGAIHPGAVRWLQACGFDPGAFRSKSWDDFEAEGAPVFDFIVTLSDNAAGEVCPVWPGKPLRSHWGVPDPAPVTGSNLQVDRAFSETARQLGSRIRLFASLPVEKLDVLSLRREMDAIGRSETAPA